MNGRWILFALALLATALFTWGLASTTGKSGASGTNAATANEVLAEVESEQITRSEVEAAAGPQLVRLQQQMFDLTDQALARAIDTRILDLEAEKQGLDRDGLLSAVIDSNPPVPQPSQVDSVWEAVQNQIQEPKEAVLPQIEAFLVNRERRARYDSLLAALRGSYDVVNYLEPPRVEVAAEGPAKGPESAPVTIVEFSDFECPYCLRIYPTLNRVMADYEGLVRLVFRQFPLNSIHPRAQKAAEASLCAHDQGSFWEMHDAMFDEPGRLDVSNLKLRAVELGLDAAEFSECLDSGRFAAQVAADLDAGQSVGITGTPALFINGRFLSGAQPYEVIARVIDDELRRGGA